MNARLAFLAITAFWVTMNALLWRAEYGAHSGETPVPIQLVWRKILTAPDSSSLSVYQSGERTGYCEISTSIGQEMAVMDADKPPPEGLAKRANYQLHMAGNIAFGDFTNRLKFDGRIQFHNPREWRELALKISSRTAHVEIRSVATNRTATITFSTDGGQLERTISFDDLQNPKSLMRAFVGDFADSVLDAMDLPDLTTLSSAQNMEWTANRTRVKIGTQTVPVYQLATSLLGREVTVDVSTLGEILRVRLPGNITAQIDELAKP